jgi:hypothetical protein
LNGKGTSRILLGVFAASILAASASAECPEFSGPIPTVVITDRLLDPSTDFDGANGPSVTSNVFRFSDAFILADFIDEGDIAVGDIRYLWNEFAYDTGTSDYATAPSTGAARAISINGNLAFETVPTYLDITTLGQTLSDTDALDFRNVAISPATPADGPFSAPPPSLLGLEGSKRLTLYIAGVAVDCDGTTDLATFDVFTVTDGSDRLSDTNIFTPYVSYGTTPPNASTFANWTFATTDNANVSRTPSVPNGGTAPGGTTAVSISTTVAYAGGALAAWFKGTAVPTTPDTVYRAVATVSSTAAANSTVLVRQRFGATSLGDLGQGEAHFSAGAAAGPNSTDGSFNWPLWVWTKSAPDPVNGGTGQPDEPAYFFDYIDGSNTLGHTFTVSRLVIEATTRAALGTGTVIRNVGDPAVGTVEGVTAPGSPTDFGTGGFIAYNAGGSDVDVTFPSDLTGVTTVDFSFNAGTTAGFCGLADLTALVPNNTSVYRTDVYLNADEAGTEVLPILRIRWISDQLIAPTQGEVALMGWVLNATDPTGTPNANTPTIDGGNRIYTSYWQPRVRPGVTTNNNYNLFVDLLYPGNVQAIINIDRVVVTEITAP